MENGRGGLYLSGFIVGYGNICSSSSVHTKCYGIGMSFLTCQGKVFPSTSSLTVPVHPFFLRTQTTVDLLELLKYYQGM